MLKFPVCNGIVTVGTSEDHFIRAEKPVEVEGQYLAAYGDERSGS